MSKEELTLLSDDGYSLSLCIYPAFKAKANIMFVHGMEEKFPDLPNMIFAHSMGTIITRNLLQEYSNDFTKIALSGYVNPNPLAPLAVFIGNVVGLFKKPKSHSKLCKSVATGPFNKAVKNPKTDSDWLSYNEENVQKYIDDPLCGVDFTVGSYKALYHLLNNMAKVKRYKNVNPELPFLLISGVDDPCTGGEKGRKSSEKLLRKAGFKDISVVTLDGMRHEILNELEKDKVYKNILEFFEK